MRSRQRSLSSQSHSSPQAGARRPGCQRVPTVQGATNTCRELPGPRPCASPRGGSGEGEEVEEAGPAQACWSAPAPGGDACISRFQVLLSLCCC